MYLTASRFWLFCSTIVCSLVCLFAVSQAAAFNTAAPNVHWQILQAALPFYGFQPDALADINAGARSQDNPANPHFWEESHHCDGNQIKQGFERLQFCIDTALDKAKFAYRDANACSEARYRFGEGLHTIQDFYSHSNYLEHQL